MSEPESAMNQGGGKGLPDDGDGGDEAVPIVSGIGKDLPANLHYYAPSSSSSSGSDHGDPEDEDENNEEEPGSDACNEQYQEGTDSNSQVYEDHEEGDGEWTYEVAEMKNGNQFLERRAGTAEWEATGDGNSRGHWGMSQDGSENMDCTNDGDEDEDENPSDDKSEEKSKTFKIFVSNLPPGLEQPVLRELFEKYGEVGECEVFAKNYAFVHMTSVEAGERALKELDGHEIEGCKLNVKRSHQKKDKKNAIADLVCGTFKLYMASLPDGVTKEYVTKLLEDYGRVVELEIYRGNSAFVHMETEEGGRKAIGALNGKKLPEDPEKTLLVAVSKKAGTPSLPTTKLKVTNVNWSVTANELRQLFMPYGLVTRVNIFKIMAKKATGRTAIVYLEQFGNIRSAIKDLNGKEVKDQSIQVEAFFGNEEDLAPPPAPKHKKKPLPMNKFGNFPQFDNSTQPFEIPRRPPMPVSGRRLVAMPSQQDLWFPSPPVQHPSGMRLVPMPSKLEIEEWGARFGAGQGGRPPPLMGQQPFPGMSNSYNDDSSYDDVLNDGFGGGYSNYNNDDNYGQYDNSSFGPPPRKIPKNKRIQNAHRSGNAGGRGAQRNQFPELPSLDEFPKVPPSLMSMQTQNPNEYDYSADLPLESFSDFTSGNNVQQDFSCDDSLQTSSLNAVPFDYAQMSNRKRNTNLNQFFNKPRNANPFSNSRGNGRGGRGGNSFRGNSRGGKKGKSRRPGLGTTEQLKKFANQCGQSQSSLSSAGDVQIPQAQEAKPSTSTSTEQQSKSDSTLGTSSSPYAPYYFQQNWNVKNKKMNRRPTAKEIKEAEEEQKRQYADFLKQKPWLYQAIPGTVKRVQQ